MTSHDVQPARRVTLAWPTVDPPDGVTLDDVENTFAVWVDAAKRRGCPPDARVRHLNGTDRGGPCMIVEWDASQDVTPPGTAPADSITVEWDSDAGAVLDWIRGHGYQAAFMDPATPTLRLRAPVFFAREGDGKAEMAFNGDTLTWDGEKISRTAR